MYHLCLVQPRRSWLEHVGPAMLMRAQRPLQGPFDVLGTHSKNEYIRFQLNFSFGNLFKNQLHRYLCKYLFRLREKTTSYQKCLERERIRCLSVHKALHKIMHTANHRLRFVFVSPWFTSFRFWFELLHYVRCILIGIYLIWLGNFIVNIDVTKWQLLQRCCCFFRVCVRGVGRKFWRPPLTPGVGYKGRILCTDTVQQGGHRLPPVPSQSSW